VVRPAMLQRLRSRFGTSAVLGETQRVERTLAVARAFLAVSALIATWLDPTREGGYAAVAYVLLVMYVVHSLLIMVLVRVRQQSSSAFRFIVHAVDVFWPALLSFFSAGLNSPFFIFTIFALLAATYRWGFLETLATSCAAIVLFFAQAIWVASPRGTIQVFFQGGFALNNFVIRSLYLLIAGYLLGYLGEEEKRLRTEISAIARVIARVQGEVGLHAALRAVFDEVLRIFGARRAALALREASSGRVFLWEALRESRSEEITLKSAELAEAQVSTYLFDPPGHTWFAGRRSASRLSRRVELYVVSAKGQRIYEAAWKPPEWFQNLPVFRAMLGVTLSFGPDWSGQAMVLDPEPSSPPVQAVPFLQALARQVTPTIYSVFLTRRLRSRVGAVERARVARELHDGVIQSLIGLEMKVDVLRRQTEGKSDLVAEELNRVQNLLHQEVLNLRELMQQMRPVDVAPQRFLDYLATTVDRFGREVGVTAHFVSPLEEVAIAPRVCTEVARILQEALVNIRKHSHARNVLVRFDAQDGNWRLLIDDDGRGFDFEGRVRLAELDAQHLGPLVIKERVRTIGGELVVESGKGRGARLEIIFPRKTYG